jgi:O-antigen/teichoic acid export membrane protein
MMSEDQYGLTRAMLSIMLISSQVALLGSPASIIRFFPSIKKQSSDPRKAYPVFLVGPFIGSTLILAAFLLFKDLILSFFLERSPLIGEYYYLILILIFGYSFFTLLDHYVKAFFSTTFATFLLEVSLRLVIIADLILFYFDVVSFDTFVLIFAANYILQLCILVVYALQKRVFSLVPSFENVDQKSIREILVFGSYSFLGGVAIILVGNIDMLMISSLIGLDDTAIYAVALYVAAVIGIPKRAVQKISYPIIADSFKNGDMHNVEQIYRKSSLNQLIIGILIYIGVWANMDNLYALLPENYANGSLVILLIGAANLFDLSAGSNRAILQASQYFRFDLYANLLLVILAFFLNLYFIPIYGIVGAAIATTASIVLYNLLKIIYVQVRLGLQPYSLRIIGVLLVAALVFALSTLIPKMNLYLDVLIRSTAMSLLFGILILSFRLSDEVNDLFFKTLKRLGFSRSGSLE